MSEENTDTEFVYFFYTSLVIAILKANPDTSKAGKLLKIGLHQDQLPDTSVNQYGQKRVPCSETLPGSWVVPDSRTKARRSRLPGCRC